MKTKKTLENKAKFFGNYFGQEIAFDKAGFKALVYDAIKPSWIESFYLELKPLSQISDKDLEKCLNILGQRLDLEYFRESFIEGLSNRDFYAQFYPVRAIEIGDYLRSKGYALPYMDLSVEDLIEHGWVKLKEN